MPAKLASSLEEEGWSVWWDRSVPTGKRYHRVIEEALAIDASRPPLVFRQLQTADLSGWTGDNQAEAFRRLVQDITAIAPPSAQPELEAPRRSPALPAPDVRKGMQTSEPMGRSHSRSDSESRAGSRSESAPTKSQPHIVRFYAFPGYLQKGKASVLTWSVKNADRVVIEGLGEQSDNGTLEVRPEEDARYRLVASSAGGEASQEVQIRVRPGRK